MEMFMLVNNEKKHSSVLLFNEIVKVARACDHPIP